MKRIITLLLLLIAFMGNTIAQTPGENFDVIHYEIHLGNFNYTDHTLQGEALVTLNATASTNTIVLELKTLTVSAVLCETSGFGINGFNQDGDLLTITLSEALSTGQSITLDILYGGNTFNESWGGVHWWGSDYVYNLGVGFESIPHNLGKTWFPCVDNFVDKATYNLYITVTNDKKAICGGNHVNTVDNGNGTSTWHWEVPQEVATYHVSFAIGDYVKWEDTYNGIERNIPIEVYVKPSQINSVPGTFVHIKEIAAFYEENFGPYPFNRIGYVCTSLGCMEHIDNIAITSGVITGNTTQEEYLAHELSHMYFGNRTTCATAENMWLNEGFAQFCGLFYRVGVYGEDDFQQAMSTKTNNITNWCMGEDNWIPLNNIPQDMTYDGSAVYNRGAVVVNTMMNYMGRENFLIGLRHYLETYAYSAASSEQLRDALTEATGIDMNGFFDTYVFTAGMPYYNVYLMDVTPNGNQYDANIQLKYKHYGPEHVGQNNRVEVTFIDNDGQTQTLLVNWDGLEAEQTVTLDIEPIAAFVDYYNHFLDAKQEQNLVATAATNIAQGKFKAIVNSVSDSTMLHIEEHFFGPDDDPGIPALTMSSRRFWNFFRKDFGEADVAVQVVYNKTTGQDDDLIQTQNDSAVLLYRSSPAEAWHFIPYTLQGNWKVAKITVDNAQSGQYAIGAFDKALLGTHENTNQPSLRLYPNPASGTIIIESSASVQQPFEYRITNLMGQALKTGSTQRHIDISSLSSGCYLIEINGTTQKIVIP